MTIAVLFVMLFGLACWGVIHARGKWPLKLLAIIAVPVIALAVSHSLNSYKGFPIKAGLPANSEYVGCLVEEPDSKTHFAGRIYLWLIPFARAGGPLDYKPSTNEPRAYSEPYARDLHQACQDADRAQAQYGHGAVGFKHGGGGVNGRGKFHHYLLPDVHLPSKKGAS